MLYLDKGTGKAGDGALEQFIEKFVLPYFPYITQFNNVDMSAMIDGLKFLQNSRVPIAQNAKYWKEFLTKTPTKTSEFLRWNIVTDEYPGFVAEIRKNFLQITNWKFSDFKILDSLLS